MRINRALLAVALAASSASCFAQFWGAIGSAPSADGGGTSLSIAGKGKGPWGFGLGFIFNSNFSKDLLDYPVPHNNYTDLGTKRTGNTIGLDGYYFFGDDGTIKPYVGIGVYFAKRADVAQSNVTGWYYTQKDQSATLLSGELGIHATTSNGYLFGVGYHTLRGPNISIGKSF